MRRLRLTAFLALSWCMLSPVHAQQPSAPPAPQGQQPVVLDSVIAIINGSVLLQSDVDEEMRFAALLPPGPNTAPAAGQRLISRVLILQEMKAQQQPVTVGDADVQKSLMELRRILPACAHERCISDAGWKAFLAENHLTEAEVQTHWRQRLAILQYIDLRFRAGIRIDRSEVVDYYQKTLVPEFQKVHEQAPPVASLAPRIREVLLQEKVNLLLRDWLQSLRDQGSVQILNPIYGQSSGDPDNSSNGNGGGA
ncbi:MAG: peptidylprolyl isomerase [Acidobacteria bacterium]|nr:peptidylprolyl isomerase [Acidobacteriota bacterium]MBW4046200.1 peptidylprolyl isomerase [Acidobacteriota bacterium]